MTDTYKDLDALVPTDKDVRFGGVNYKLPGDIPLEIFVRVSKASELEDVDEVAAMEEMVGALTDLFATMYAGTPQERVVREDVEKVLRKRGVQFITQMLRNIYNEAPVETPADAEGNSQTSSGNQTTNT